MEDEIREAPELIGAMQLGYYHHCPLCNAPLFYSCGHGKLVCTKSGLLFDLDDILTTELEIEEVQ